MTFLEYVRGLTQGSDRISTLEAVRQGYITAVFPDPAIGRSEMIAQLTAAGYLIGRNSNSQVCVAGVSVEEPAVYIVRADGRLIKAPAGTAGDINVVDPVTGRTPASTVATDVSYYDTDGTRLHTDHLGRVIR
jgi:hypothetical protein